MESYGAKLRDKRESLNLTIEQVAEDTLISISYLQGLEEENEGAFPGSTYLTGFLRNYAKFLGLNEEELVRLYENVKKQESPFPQELLEREKPKFLVPLIVVLSSIFVIGIGIWLYFFVFKVPERQAAKALLAEAHKKNHQYNFDGSTQNVRLYIGDQIFIPTGVGNGSIVVTVSDTKNALSVLTPSGTQVIELSEERALDVTGDSVPDIILYVSDVDIMDGSRGAEVRMMLKDRTTNGIVEIVDDGVEEGGLTSSIEIQSSNGAPRTVIHEDTRAYPFTVNVSFRGSCIFRYQSDRNPREENYYKNGEVINVSSNNGFRLWASNINAMKIQVIAGLSTYDLEMGKAGEVVVEDIKWVRDSDGMYRLIVQNVD